MRPTYVRISWRNRSPYNTIGDLVRGDQIATLYPKEANSLPSRTIATRHVQVINCEQWDAHHADR